MSFVKILDKIRIKLDKISFVKILAKIKIKLKVALSKFYPGRIQFSKNQIYHNFESTHNFVT